jgi:hypothetical protein
MTPKMLGMDKNCKCLLLCSMRECGPIVAGVLATVDTDKELAAGGGCCDDDGVLWITALCVCMVWVLKGRDELVASFLPAW